MTKYPQYAKHNVDTSDCLQANMFLNISGCFPGISGRGTAFLHHANKLLFFCIMNKEHAYHSGRDGEYAKEITEKRHELRHFKKIRNEYGKDEATKNKYILHVE